MFSINILLAALVSVFGVAAGYFLKNIAKEEISAGRKYFAAMEKVLFVSIFVPVIYYNTADFYWPVLIFSASAFLVLFVMPKTILRLSLRYMAFTVFMIILIDSQTLFLIEATLVFLYGLPVGSLIGK